MQLKKRSCDEGLPSYGNFGAHTQSKTRKRIENKKDFHFSSIYEEGESPSMLQ